MRFIIMHKTNAEWEAGAVPGADLIARVGALMGELAAAGVLLAGEGLRPTSEGVRLRFSGGTRHVLPGPFPRGNELPAGFTILRAASLEDAIDWACRQGDAGSDVEIDIRPVTEPWDIGMAPKPPGLTTRRYMLMRKATAATEEAAAGSSEQQPRLSQLIQETTRTGVHLVTETMGPSRRGRRYKNSVNGVSVFDGPFVETKELIGGYVIVSAGSLDDVDRWARRYIEAVGAEEVDVRELA